MFEIRKGIVYPFAGAAERVRNTSRRRTERVEPTPNSEFEFLRSKKAKRPSLKDGLLRAYLATRKADEPFATRRPLTKTPAVWILLSQKGRAYKLSSVAVAHGRAKTHCVFASAVQVGQRLLYSFPAVALAPKKIYTIFFVSALEVLTSVFEIRKGMVYPFAGAAERVRKTSRRRIERVEPTPISEFEFLLSKKQRDHL